MQSPKVNFITNHISKLIVVLIIISWLTEIKIAKIKTITDLEVVAHVIFFVVRVDDL